LLFSGIRVTAALLFLSCGAGMILLGSGCTSEETVLAESKYHPEGWLTNESPDYHGNECFTKGLDECYKCHGDDLTGGLVQVSCYDCHGEGKDNCIACHGGQSDSTGAPPYGLRGEVEFASLAVGAHETHVKGLKGTDGIGCEACHIVPAASWDSTHYDFALLEGPGIIDSIAEVTWGGIAGTEGVWDRATGTCEDTYCHGNFYNGDTTNAVVWTGLDQSACGSCHDDKGNTGDLGRDHQFHIIIGVGCEGCHAATVDTASNIIGPAFHVDGEKTIKFTPDTGNFVDGTCNDPGGCHGTFEWH
jgi:predicted CxxxxCH...CXXCH cytochrome family protein